VKLPYAPMETAAVRLEPLGPEHKEDLRAACAADPALWVELYPFSMDGEHFEIGWQRLIRDSQGPAWNAYAVVVGGRCVGMSSYIAIDDINATLEIGGTYYAPDHRGGATNPAAKRLLLARAFSGGARRVQFKVDAINARSRAAVLKLGATQEGVLRSDRVTWTGRVRDTVVFSILAAEWPGVRDALDQRLSAAS
jgi:RimJ/RimL family protein N-acetyltransferase